MPAFSRSSHSQGLSSFLNPLQLFTSMRLARCVFPARRHTRRNGACAPYVLFTANQLLLLVSFYPLPVSPVFFFQLPPPHSLQEPDAAQLPNDYAFPTMDELADQVYELLDFLRCCDIHILRLAASLTPITQTRVHKWFYLSHTHVRLVALPPPSGFPGLLHVLRCAHSVRSWIGIGVGIGGNILLRCAVRKTKRERESECVCVRERESE